MPVVPKLVLTFAITGLIVPSVFAEDEKDESIGEEGKRCLPSRQISSTQVIDSEHIVFRMRGGEIYVSKLKRRCPGLRPRDAFSYRTSSNRLCDIDVITVLDNFGGSLRQGGSCRLGKFYPISEDEIKAMKGEPELEAEPIPPAEPEQPEVPEKDE